MRALAFIFTLLFMSYPLLGHTTPDKLTTPESSALTWPAGLPVYDHIIIVVEENKDYEEIIGHANAPYINNLLKKEGANFTQIYGEEHYSQGNYFWMFSGDNQTIGFTDHVPSEKNHPKYPFTTANLGEQLINKGLSFKGYAESLPEIGFTGEKGSGGLYARKHVPWISFANVPNGTTVATSSNLRFADFPSDPSQYHTLPTVAFVIPNLDNDMHNGPITKSVAAGDQWLQKHIDPYYQWAKDHNSLLILTFDENDDKRGYRGLTNPLVDPQSCIGEGRDEEYCVDMQNRIVTIFAGAHIKAGDYPEGEGITHVNILRTLEAMYGLSRAGAQQDNAAGGGISDDFIITDVFELAQ
ncbi:MAG: alkaline phosphatase family protein [Proteobacteria bacterium]|nr:alkaline phosphatase family protein [Pseudomonadota bacterium]MBU1138742.1 alkaline phosphatase family protein [Pseudomonadota bacterium]